MPNGGGYLGGDDADRLAQRNGADPISRLFGKELVEHDAEREDIATNISLAGNSSLLLGAHVIEGANQTTFLGEGSRECLHGESSGSRDSEIDDADLGPVAVRDDEHVRRFEVPVDDSFAMRILDCPTHL